jgi:hypothetical protein
MVGNAGHSGGEKICERIPVCRRRLFEGALFGSLLCFDDNGIGCAFDGVDCFGLVLRAESRKAAATGIDDPQVIVLIDENRDVGWPSLVSGTGRLEDVGSIL